MSWENINTTQMKSSIIVNGYATEDITPEMLAQWADDLTYVSYYSYGFNMEGDLIPFNDGNLIQNAYNSGVAPLMVLTPFDENGKYRYELVRTVFTNPVVRDQLINNIVLTVIEKNYFGMVFNFGYIETQDKDQFVITVSKTSARLNRRAALVIVSLVAGVNDAGIDYESLGRAANFLELRTFYWEQALEPPAAISPIDRIREMLSLLTAVVNPRGILLGFTNYGYDWTLPFVQGVPAQMISHTEAAERARRTRAAVQYNEIVQAPHYNYTNVSGSYHEVWYEDARSIRAKLELVNAFDLAGVSIWTIMNSFPAVLETIRELYTVFKVS